MFLRNVFSLIISNIVTRLSANDLSFPLLKFQLVNTSLPVYIGLEYANLQQ